MMTRPAIRPVVAQLVAAGILCLTLGPAATAQELDITSRADEQARLQAEKAKIVTPLVRNKAERAFKLVEETGLLGTTPGGFYPWFGSVLGGGGVAVGAGYRFGFGDDGGGNLLAGWSFYNYKLLQSTMNLPSFAGGRFHPNIEAKWIDAPGVNFFGVGNDSREANKTTYLYRPTRVGSTLSVNVTKWFSVGGGGDFLNVHTGAGHHSPSIEEIFTPATVPGLGTQITYGVARAGAAVDWRTSPGYSRRGGLYSFEWSNYIQSDGSKFSFQQFDSELLQFIPLLRENWVLVFRGVASTTTTNGNKQVPYSMMPYLGSGETLRAFQNRRFRDRNSLLLQAEYRWTPSHLVDMALFTDSGKVAARSGDLNFDGLHTDYGIGIRFHAPKFTVFRMDLAHGSEGFNLVFSTGIF